MAFGARPSNTRTREESDAQVAQALVAALGILKAEPLRISHVRDGSDFLMSGPGPNPFGSGGVGGPGGFPPNGGGGVGGGGGQPIDPEVGTPGEAGPPGPAGATGPAGPPGPPGPTGPSGSNGSTPGVNGYIDFVSDVTYDTSDQCLKKQFTRVYGFFEGSGTGGAVGADSTGTAYGGTARDITCAEECDS